MDQKTVMVVDDEPSIVHLLADVLEEEGYVVRRCFDGRAALNTVKRDPPDLVVSDVMMPGLDGIAVAVAIQEQGIPVILMSAVTLHRAVPGVPFIPKPFDLDNVLDTVADALVA